MVGGFGAGAALLIYLSTIFFRHAASASTNLWLSAIFLLAAALCAGLAIRAWRTRRTALKIDSAGRVSYGERELCAGGTVHAVRIAGARGGEVGDCEVVLELAEGKIVSIPSQYFAGFRTRRHARQLAAKLAESLGVPVTDSH
jgi:hypothetical protein